MRVLADPRCLGHLVPPGFPERPERLTRLLERFRGDPRFELLERAWLPDEEVETAAAGLHEPRYVERVRRAIARGDGLIDGADNPVSAGSWSAALGAAGAALAAVDQVLSGASARAFAAVRPPGHHAERDRAMGFCLLDNVALAAERALRRHGLARVAIVDFDVHHGNGTQHLFERRGDVLYASLHQWPFYPGTGAADERGEGEGLGATVNVPLPAGTGDDVYRDALRTLVLPALERHRPELLLLSAGFDAWREDPLGGMRVSAAGFAEWGRILFDAADRLCGGRAVGVLEGGYDLAALPALVAGFLLGAPAVDA